MERIYSGYFHPKSMEKDIYKEKSMKAESKVVDTQKLSEKLLQELMRAVYAGGRVFVFAYSAKAVTAVLLASRKWSTIRFALFDATRLFLRRDTIRFGCFMGCLVGSFRMTEALLRLTCSYYVCQRGQYFIAGGVAGLSIYLDAKNRRKTLATYLFVRACHVYLQYLTSVGCIPTFKYTSEVLFSLCHAPIMYAFILEPGLLPRSYYQFILNNGAVTEDGMNELFRPGLSTYETFGVPRKMPFRSCRPHNHIEPCKTHLFLEFFRGILRAAKLYAPVHIIPVLVFRFKALFNSPGRMLTKLCKSIFYSCLFLSLDQTIVKTIMCTVRNTLHHDYRITPWIAGLFSGVSIFAEDTKRRTEIMLYCLPRSFSIVQQFLQHHYGVWKPRKNIEILIFSLSMAIIMSTPPKHFKPTYIRIVKFLFGDHIL